ncbi:LytR/AlgR family response regulator transcription factor [Spirosoma linguale]|uniref:Two component transcriptional regulator, LytTR family n=1 Tax=Spirosoma linguale (strain ATCC 33905 / DSM 74 / LMG 10896 / Claus 1) TaxID=504472 RepID=D2QBZ2_SPILD|nr:two component transcriptional regulator, LytTR family [Spirosoma linguale DSM 74]
MTILIIEDEPKSARLLQQLIESVRADARVTGICGSIEETVHSLSRYMPDLLFMDIELADGNSFDVFRQLPVTAPVIFCTAYDEYMVDAFKTNGIYYLLKPVDEADVRAAFAKLDTIAKALTPDPATLTQFLPQWSAATQYNRSFLVRVRERLVPVAVADIECIAFEHEVSYLYTRKNDKYPLFKTMDEIEAALDPTQFFRINRQMIVQRNAIVAIEPYFNRKVVLTLTAKPADLPIVSRLKVTPFLAWVEKA